MADKLEYWSQYSNNSNAYEHQILYICLKFKVSMTNASLVIDTNKKEQM